MYTSGQLYDMEQAELQRDKREETLIEVSDKLNIPLETLKSSLTSKSYCDCHINDSGYVDSLTINMTAICGDIPKQNNLPHSSKLCGYVEIDGTYHECEHWGHENMIRQLIWNSEDFKQKYFETKASFYDNMPRGMLQEEYFAMKVLGFIKISSFENTPSQMVVFWYNNLTYKQTDFIYPR